MSYFEDILKSGESLFLNEVALDYSYIPKLIPYRETQQKQIAVCIKPLFANRNGKNLLIHGEPGVGKTVACKHVLNEIEENYDEVVPLYVNCWQKNSSYKVLLEMCDILGYKFVQNKKTEELLKVVKNILNEKQCVFCFDEADKLEEMDIVYTLIEEIYNKSIIMITNYKDWLLDMDPRIKSRLMPDMLYFAPYNASETRGILKERMQFAFVENVWQDDAFDIILAKTVEKGDIRVGLHLMKEAGILAEDSSAKRIELAHAKMAVDKLDAFTSKDPNDLEADTRIVLEIIKEKGTAKIGELYRLYKEKNGEATYKTFQRKIEKLDKNKFICLTKTCGGKEGNTTIVSANTDKKLTDF